MPVLNIAMVGSDALATEIAKSTETRDIVEFELAAPFDLAGVRSPKRLCTRDNFPSIGTFIA